MKKFLLVIGAVFVLGILWYLLSPLWRTVELDEASPLGPELAEKEASDNPYMPPMDDATKAEFARQMEEMKDIVVEKSETMPAARKLLASAPFVPRVHSVSGNALLIEDQGKKILRFENFETDNGPDLRVYLAADLRANDFVELAPLRATKGNVNYDVPAGVDTAKYNKVLIWCKAFGVLFSSAEF